MRDFLLIGVGAIFALFGTWLNHHLQMLRENNRFKFEKKHELFSKLMGLRPVIFQLYKSRFEALIWSYFHEFRAKYGNPFLDMGTPDNEWSEAEKWIEKTCNFDLEIAKVRRELYENVGLVRVFFKTNSNLNLLVECVYKHQFPSIIPIPSVSSDSCDEPPSLNDILVISRTWKTNTFQNLQTQLTETLDDPIQNLLEYLEKELA